MLFERDVRLFRTQGPSSFSVKRLLIQSDANPWCSERICDPSHVRNVVLVRYCHATVEWRTLRKKVARYGIRKKKNNVERFLQIADLLCRHFLSRSLITHGVSDYDPYRSYTACLSGFESQRLQFDRPRFAMWVNVIIPLPWHSA